MNERTTLKAHETARALRKEMTVAEKKLWQLLRRKQLCNTEFRRQHPKQAYILDFYAPEIKLAIELDGSVHDGSGQKQHDTQRDRNLSAWGITVLRFSNDDIEDRPQFVLDVIEMKISHLKMNIKEKYSLPFTLKRGKGRG